MSSSEVGLLELVHQDEDADPEIPSRLPENFEEGGEVLPEASGIGDPSDGLYIHSEAHRSGGINLEAEGLEDAQEPPEPPFWMPACRGSQRAEERSNQAKRKWGGGPSLHLRRDPSATTDLFQQLIEQHRLAHAPQSTEDPASIALAELLGASAEELEGFENLLAPGE